MRSKTTQTYDRNAPGTRHRAAEEIVFNEVSTGADEPC